jgi:hypothetical protein
MDDNYKQYQEEYNYSGKIKNLTAYVGYQRVILAWDNPVDQKSKTTLITFGNEKLEYDHLVDSVSIENLQSGSGYDFYVYTKDAEGNLSVPVTVSVLPVSLDFVSRLVAPGCKSTKSKTTYGLAWNSLSNVSMRLEGTIDYVITGSDGLSLKGTIIVPKATKTNAVTAHTQLFPEMKVGITYTVSYTVSVWPIVSKIVTEDIVKLQSSVKFTL